MNSDIRNIKGESGPVTMERKDVGWREAKVATKATFLTCYKCYFTLALVFPGNRSEFPSL
jgi:hypothetical protein